MGERVDLISDAGPIPGTVVKQGVSFGDGEETRKFPYEVRLDNGKCEIITEDTEKYIVASNVPPLEIKHSQGARVECKLANTDVWRQGTIVRSNNDWAEHDRPPYFIRFIDDDGQPEYEGFWGPNGMCKMMYQI